MDGTVLAHVWPQHWLGDLEVEWVARLEQLEAAAAGQSACEAAGAGPAVQVQCSAGLAEVHLVLAPPRHW